MKLNEFRIENQLLIQVDGRLDASWADYFKEALLKRVRSGEHHILLEVSELTFLSSLGIRSLMALYKELHSVQGTFQIIHADGMVKETLEHSGLGQWLSDLKVDVARFAEQASAPADSDSLERFTLDPAARLTVSVVDAWHPWSPVNRGACRAVSFEKDRVGIGIGGAGNDVDAANDYFGEFVAVGGHVAVQPPDERGRPDCILSEQEFVPSLHCIQAQICHGSMAHLIRFRSTDETPFYTLSSLVGEMLRVCGSDPIGFTVIGEVEGLVGANLIRSPGKLTEGSGVDYPTVKEWMSFCGERGFAREQAALVGTARRAGETVKMHVHGAVFPYQLLPNGRIELQAAADRLFCGPPPKAVLHLVNDQRRGNGLGESALFSGACWCAAIENGEVLL
jgi:anti-anti-sigma factor